MKSLRKLSKLKLAGLIVIFPFLVAGTVFAYNIATPSKPVNNSAQTEQSSTSKKTDKRASNSERIDTATDQAASESSGSILTQTTTQAPRTSTTQPTQTATNTAPQQTAANPTPTTPTCHESMKASYASLYNSKVNAENASWNNQITAWNNYASSRGMAFSGYVQDQINQNKPAHDARLAQYQTEYYQNLASINCSP